MAESLTDRLSKPETLAEARDWQSLRDAAIAQGMCYPCAVQAAYWSQIGLSYLPDLRLCRACERRLNPQPVKDVRTGRFEARKGSTGTRASRTTPNAVCAVCEAGFRAKRSTALYCSARCRQKAVRERNRSGN